MVTASRSRVAAGFTLIELLLATSLLMFILAMAMYGYQLFNQQWQRNLSDIEIAFNKAQRLDLLSEALQGIIPYMVNGVDNAPGFYFLGKLDGFTAVTASPIVNTGSYAVIRVFIESTDDGYQLVYEEASLRNTFLLSPQQVLPFNDRLVILTAQEQIRFSYGVLQFDDQASDYDGFASSKMQLVWREQIDGVTTKTHPVKLSINLAGFPIYAQVAQRHQVLANRSATEFY